MSARHVGISDLLGKTFTRVTDSSSEGDLVLYLPDGSSYRMLHMQDCCEDVNLEEIVGDLADLENSPILVAEEIDYTDGNSEGTRTFYKLATIKGYVTLRWYGTSNGYYSETADVYFTPVEVY